MQVSQSVKFAALVVVIVVLYFLVRALFVTGAVETATESANAPFSVVAQRITPEPWQAEIVVRGRSAADRKVIARAEISGAVTATPTPEGSQVRAGDVLCEIALNARNAQLAETRAAFQKAKLDHDAAVKLHEGGFRSETAVASAKAALDLASANLKRAEIILSQTKITAPFDGIFDKRMVEVGDFVNIGDACGSVIQKSPFIVTGAVAEKDVGKISIGDRGVARFATGQTVEGVVRYVAASADPATRTFTVELEVPNEDGVLRDGVTADFTIYAREDLAHHTPRSALTIDDDGKIGVRIVSSEDEVQFIPVTLLGEDGAGIWVDGLEGEVDLIVRGQDFVTVGQKVGVVYRSADANESET